MFNKNLEAYHYFLASLPDQDLAQFCSIDRFTAQLCNHPYLWLMKIKELYPTFPPTMTTILSLNELKNVYFDLKYQDWKRLRDLADDLEECEDDTTFKDWLDNVYEYQQYALEGEEEEFDYDY